MIDNKIAGVPDSTCKDCPQLWEDECRAFQQPHSEAERQSRRQGHPRPLCITQRSDIPLNRKPA